jgi:hypothetical protein
VELALGLATGRLRRQYDAVHPSERLPC